MLTVSAKAVDVSHKCIAILHTANGAGGNANNNSDNDVPLNAPRAVA